MKKDNIVLIGFMGAGKSLGSIDLQKRLGLSIVSTDQAIVDQEGLAIVDIFAQKGEAYFRQLEQEVIEKIAQKSGVIIDCGGGVVLNPKNVTALKATGTIFYLQASVDQIMANLAKCGHQDRPLLAGGDPQAKVESLLSERKKFYEAAADVVIDTDGKTVGEFCDLIASSV